MIEIVIAIIILLGIVITLLVALLGHCRCPDCSGKLIDNDYDEIIDKTVWTCQKCGKKWILL